MQGSHQKAYCACRYAYKQRQDFSWCTTPEVLTAQQAAQKVAVAHSSPVQMTELESVDSSSAAETGTETEGEPETETETDAEARRQSDDNGAPPRPTLREPPPELDDMPPRPTFKEPPPDDGPYTSTRPATFVSPPASPPPEPAFPAAAVGAEGRLRPVPHVLHFQDH